VEVGADGRARLHGAVARAAERRGGEVRVSLTHTGGMAGAVAVVS
jgi:phosphopantetheinyl transferase (holo-ACP synthase)